MLIGDRAKNTKFLFLDKTPLLGNWFATGRNVVNYNSSASPSIFIQSPVCGVTAYCICCL